MKKNVSGVTTSYFYSGSVVISEKQGSTWTDYIFFGNQRIAQQTGSTLTAAKFLHQDHLGSTRVCSDGSGNSAGTCDYEPFGEFQPGSACSSLPTNYRFAGMYYDSESGLYYTWFRQYDANQGRWMSVDPLPGSPDDPQSLNRYSYVRNDSANLVDPSGLCSLQITYDVHVVWQCYGGPPGAEGSRCTIIGGYIEITSANIVGVCGDRAGGGRGSGEPPAPKPPGLPTFSQAAYDKCAQQAFGASSGIIPNSNGRAIPSKDAALAVFQATLLGGFDAALTAATMAYESDTNLYPFNSLNQDIGPMQLNLFWAESGSPSYIYANTFGTNLLPGQQFNGDPISNIQTGALKLRELRSQPERYTRKSARNARRRNLARTVPLFQKLFDCLMQNLSF